MSCDRLLPFDLASSRVAGAVRCGSRVFLSGRSALRPDGTVAGLGDAAAQTHAALDSIEAALQAAGGSLSDITRLTTSLVDRAHRKPVYEAIGRRLRDVFPVSTGLLVAGLNLPELMVQIDAEAVVGSPVQRLRSFEMKDWFGQDIAWQGAMVAAGETELFVRGQTGSALDGSFMAGWDGGRICGAGRPCADRLATLLGQAGSGMDEVCKITVLISDRAYQNRSIGDRAALRGIHPVDRADRGRLRGRSPVRDRRPCAAQTGRRASATATLSLERGALRVQPTALDCDFCMAVCAGGR
jgi:enamine deaminase RidA (YjgF/YER057c/UK114 family)